LSFSVTQVSHGNEGLFSDFCSAAAPQPYGASDCSLVPKLCLGMHMFRSLPETLEYSQNQVDIKQSLTTGILPSAGIAQ
jgi:hypothetical protein